MYKYDFYFCIVALKLIPTTVSYVNKSPIRKEMTAKITKLFLHQNVLVSAYINLIKTVIKVLNGTYLLRWASSDTHMYF